MLELRNIYFKRDNKQILNNINIKIDDNKFVAITGPNGGGKSTLAKIIMGIEKPDSGIILYNNEDITNLDITQRSKKGIGFAFQQPIKFKGLTVNDLISLSVGEKIKFSAACDYLSDVGLCARDYINREINSSLSGGELKRIEIATVAARKSKFTIFDEPEAGIDLWSFSKLIQVFEKLHDELNGSIVIISHQEKILNIADNIILIANGEIKKSGTRDEILKDILNNSKKCKFFRQEVKK